jgi:hypothetical protein
VCCKNAEKAVISTHQFIPDIFTAGVEGDDELLDRRLDPKNFGIFFQDVKGSVNLHVRRLLVKRRLKFFVEKVSNNNGTAHSKKCKQLFVY